MEAIRVKILRPGAALPAYGTAEAAGADLTACLEAPVTIEAGSTAFIPTGIALEVPVGCAGLVYARSGMACKQDLAPANKVGVIDSDYRGEFLIALHNHGGETRTVRHGDRVAQLVVTPILRPCYVEGESLDETLRGTGGFGSTGK